MERIMESLSLEIFEKGQFFNYYRQRNTLKICFTNVLLNNTMMRTISNNRGGYHSE